MSVALARDWLAELRAAVEANDGVGSAVLLREIAKIAPGLRQQACQIAKGFGAEGEKWAKSFFVEVASPPLVPAQQSTFKLRKWGPAKSGLAAELGAALERKEEAKAEPQAEPVVEEEEPEAEPEVKTPAGWPRPAFSFDEPIEADEPAELSATAPYDNAHEFARRECWKDGTLAVYCWRGEFWEWNGRVYERIANADLRAKLYTFLDGSVKREGLEHRVVKFSPKPKAVTDMLDGLSAGLALPNWFEPPMWLNTGARGGEVLMFQNKALDVRTGAPVPATPNLWIHGGVRYDWDPKAGCPEWRAFLGSIFPGDQDARIARAVDDGGCEFPERSAVNRRDPRWERHNPSDW